MAFADDVQSYCRTDEDVSDFIAPAEEYLANLGIAQDESDPLYALAVKKLVLWWYDNRNPSDSTADDMRQPYGLSGIIVLLQSAQEESDDASG